MSSLRTMFGEQRIGDISECREIKSSLIKFPFLARIPEKTAVDLVGSSRVVVSAWLGI